jgi:hypothetical protein
MNILEKSIKGKDTGTMFDLLPPDVVEVIYTNVYKLKYRDSVQRILSKTLWRRIKSRRTNASVIDAWMLGVEHKCGNLSTDGVMLFSYNLMIGLKHRGRRVVLDYTARGIGLQSQTTSTHVNKAKQYAQHVVSDDNAELREMVMYCHANCNL